MQVCVTWEAHLKGHLAGEQTTEGGTSSTRYVDYDKNVLVMTQTDQGGFTCMSPPRFGELIVIRPSVYNEVQLDRQVNILTSDVTK